MGESLGPVQQRLHLPIARMCPMRNVGVNSVNKVDINRILQLCECITILTLVNTLLCIYSLLLNLNLERGNLRRRLVNMQAMLRQSS